MPVTKAHARGFAVQLLVALVLSSVVIVRAQTIEIKLVNGKNGHPIAHTCVNVGADHLDHMLAIPTDQNGIARFRLTNNSAEVNINNHWKACGDWGVIDPIVKYSDVIGINAGYVLCQPHTPDYSWLAKMTLTTRKVLEQGIVTPNTCGDFQASLKPGEVVIFVRPLTWREKLKQ